VPNIKQIDDNYSTQVETIQLTRATDWASWAVVYSHNLWIAPTTITATSSYSPSGTSGATNWFYDWINNFSTHLAPTVLAANANSTTSIISYYEGASDLQKWAVTATSSTDITITWTKTSTPGSWTIFITLLLTV
jgi:hypothetical protein